MLIIIPPVTNVRKIIDMILILVVVWLLTEEEQLTYSVLFLTQSVLRECSTTKSGKSARSFLQTGVKAVRPSMKTLVIAAGAGRAEHASPRLEVVARARYGTKNPVVVPTLWEVRAVHLEV